MRIFSYIFLILIITLGITFAMLNSQTVNFNYYLNNRTLPLSLLLAASFTVGCIIGLFVSIWVLIKDKVKTYHLRQQLKMAEKEIENLRAIPLQDKH